MIKNKASTQFGIQIYIEFEWKNLATFKKISQIPTSMLIPGNLMVHPATVKAELQKLLIDENQN